MGRLGQGVNRRVFEIPEYFSISMSRFDESEELDLRFRRFRGIKLGILE
jgi:hypothetical protein